MGLNPGAARIFSPDISVQVHLLEHLAEEFLRLTNEIFIFYYVYYLQLFCC